MGVPLVKVGSLGGTITMTRGSGGEGVVPSLGAEDLVSAVPGVEAVARVESGTLSRLPGASLTPEDLIAALHWAGSAVEEGADGVVITQGTDSLEESAFLLDLYWRHPASLVFTGAMRPPHVVGADGPANLLAAVTVAADPRSRGMGALVVLNDDIHEARRVRKAHTTALHAFTSPDGGPLGQVVEGQVAVLRQPAVRHDALPLPASDGQVQVALLEMSLGDRGDLIRLAAQAGYDGIVVSAFGVGHVSEAAADVVGELSGEVPVIIASRTGAGATLERTYGFPGSERDLQARGALFSGRLDARKARLLLWALLRAGATAPRIAQEFAVRGGLVRHGD